MLSARVAAAARKGDEEEERRARSWGKVHGAVLRLVARGESKGRPKQRGATATAGHAGHTAAWLPGEEDKPASAGLGWARGDGLRWWASGKLLLPFVFSFSFIFLLLC